MKGSAAPEPAPATAQKTTVLRITASRRALYWRASTLDVFVGDRWIEALYPVALSDSDRALPEDPLLPRAAGVARDWVRQDVEVAALVDAHLVGAAQPASRRSTPTGCST